MEANFWKQRWEIKQIGFHEKLGNELFQKHFSKLSLKDQQTIFLPLCGKTIDIHWLLSQGVDVLGVELVESAIIELFQELQVVPQITQMGELKLYQSHHIKIFVGDFFKLSSAHLGKVHAIYDRASLVALPPVMRQSYREHLIKITQKAPQLLITFEYDQALFPGPPFSVDEQEVRESYQSTYKCTPLETKVVPQGIGKVAPAIEKIWKLD